MKKEEFAEIPNQILMKVAGGVNYASDLARKMGKSIPVMFRQLDELLGRGILTKQRHGKRVEYAINWKSLALNFASLVKKEFDYSKEALSRLKLPSPNLKDLQETFESVFSTEYMQNFFKEMYKDLEHAGKVSYDYARMRFNDSINIILEIFGTTSKEKEILKKVPKNREKDFEKFFKTSQTYSKLKKEIDPKTKLKEKL